MTGPGPVPAAEDLDRLLLGADPDPHRLLGPHRAGTGTVVRALRPGAEAVVAIRADGTRHPLTEVVRGLFAGVLPGPGDAYRLQVRRAGRTDVVDDPYRWPPLLAPDEVALVRAGRHPRLWRVLGAQPGPVPDPAGEPVPGVTFRCWAPNARGVRVAGDFDGWSGRGTPLRDLGEVWELFVPGVEPGSRYAFRILGADGRWREHADPMAAGTQLPPARASVVTTTGYAWRDQDWLAARAAADRRSAPMSVYEVHAGSWRPGLSYRELAHELGTYVVEMGFTHVEFLPLTEHPYGGSWGYQVTSYFAPTSRFGTPDDLRYLVDHLHSLGIGVILDWVPAHFPKDAWALARFDGTALYEHADPRRGEQPDWGTLVFDLGRAPVRGFLTASALFWLEEFHLDGLRVDAVASMLYLDYSRPDGGWLPNADGGRENHEAVAFLRELNAAVHDRVPGALMLAEESTAWPGVTAADGLGFDLKWNMGWMHDTLSHLGRDPVYRSHHLGEITFALEYAWDERHLLPLSHDEVVHGKGSLWSRMPGDDARRAAGLRGLLALMWAHPGRKLLFMGGEFGQPWEWDADGGLGWHLLTDGGPHRGIQQVVAELNSRYRHTPALHGLDDDPAGFAWLVRDAERTVVAFLRLGPDGSRLACVVNLAGVDQEYRVGVPVAGAWREVLNTDRVDYGGAGVLNGTVTAVAEPAHGQPASVLLRLPANGTVWLAPAGVTARLA